MTLVMNVREALPVMLDELRRTIDAVDGRGRSLIEVETLEAHLSRTSLAPLRVATAIIGASTTLALLLSVLGLYGTLNDAARQRRVELALRVALGAGTWNVIGQVLKEGARLAAAGSVLGVAGSWIVSRWLPGIALDSGAKLWWVWFAGPLVLAAAVAIASVLPARRALAIEPIKILREDR